MQNQLEQLNFTLSNLYFKNLNYLKKNHPKVFEKVDKLSKAIENNSYKEAYSLEYKEEGYFDILNLKTNEFLYNINSYIEADLRKERIDFSQNSSLNLLRINPFTNNFALMEGLGEIRPFVEYLNKKINFQNINFSKIFKIIYIGTGLGLHIYEIHKKIDAHSTLIIEDNLEIFRLSLFTTDYSIFSLNNRSLFLSIQENEEEKKETLEEFEYDNSWMNYNIKHHIFSINEKVNLDKIIEHFSIHHASMFSYKEVLKVISRTVNFIKKDYAFLKLKPMIEKKPLKDKKVLIISAGPSLDKSIEWIKENQHKFVIICVDIILKKLESNNIKPDIIVSIDPKDIIGKFFDLKDINFIKDSAIIFASQQHESVMQKVKDLNFYFVQPFSVSLEPGFHFAVPNVGTYSFGISLFLGANEVYLAGSDAAFNQETGSRYSNDNTKIQIDMIEDQEELKQKGIVSESDIIEVAGNLRDSVKTNRELLRFKESYERFVYEHKKVNKHLEFTAYNISDGVYIEGFIPKDFNQIELNSFENKQFTKELIDEISSKLEHLEFEEDIVIINSIIQRVKKFSKLKIKTKDELLRNKIDLMIWIFEQKKKMSNGMFADLFFRFTDLIDIYINYSLHLTQKDLNTKEFFEELKRYWANSLISLLQEIKQSVLKV